MEAEQRALVAAAAKSDFLSNMSHEIRTPLNGVLAVSEVLARTPLDERQAEMVRLIGTSGRTLLRVMDDLVEFSRLEGDQIEFDVRPFELEETIRTTCEAARTRAEAKGLRFDMLRLGELRRRLPRRSGAHRPGAGQPAQQRGEVHRGGPYQRLGHGRGAAGRQDAAAAGRHRHGRRLLAGSGRAHLRALRAGGHLVHLAQVRRTGPRPFHREAPGRADAGRCDGPVEGRRGLDLRGHRADLARPHRRAGRADGGGGRGFRHRDARSRTSTCWWRRTIR